MEKRSVIQGTHECPVEKGARPHRGPLPPRRERQVYPGRSPVPQSADGGTRISRAAVARHSRKCNVCKHPDRKAIEDAFLRWRSPDDIAEEYGIADHSSIYRHVHATGVFARRCATIRLALEPLLEHAHHVKVTAHAIISAARLYAQINNEGQFVPPTRTVIFHHVTEPAAPGPEQKSADSNRQTPELDHAPTN